MVKFGEHLAANIAPEFGPEAYIDYEGLDKIIKTLLQTAPSG
jgi:SPX domain protein involved in polyphosphate accumulation